jgi:hypothetical protein
MSDALPSTGGATLPGSATDAPAAAAVGAVQGPQATQPTPVGGFGAATAMDTDGPADGGHASSSDEADEDGGGASGSGAVPAARTCPQLSAALAPLMLDLEQAHAAVLDLRRTASPELTAALALRAVLLRRLGVVDSPGRPNFDAQVSAVLKSVRGLLLGSDDDVNVADRGLVVMPCGTGKSYVGLWTTLAHVAFADAKDVLVLAPSLYLVKQLLDTYADGL